MKPIRPIKAWLVRHTFGSERIQLADSSFFMKKKDAIECRDTCGDGYLIIEVEIRPLTKRRNK